MSYKTIDYCLFYCHILHVMLVQNYQFVPNFQKMYVQMFNYHWFMFTGGTHKPRLDRSRCMPSQSPQDILHPSWRRWPWHGSYRCKETLGTIFTITPCGKPLCIVKDDIMYNMHTCFQLYSIDSALLSQELKFL